MTTNGRPAAVIITPVLLGLISLVFIAMGATGVSLNDPSISSLLAWGANYGPDTVSGQWWRLLTATFLHIGFLHLLSNAVCLWVLGRSAEPLFGSRRFAAVYVLSGLGGSVTSLAVHPVLVTAGASGAVFGIAGSLLALQCLQRIPAPSRPSPDQLVRVAPFVLYNLLNGFTHPGIDNAGHIGGLVTGFALGVALPLPSSTARVLRVRTFAAILGALLLIIAGAVVVGREQAPIGAYGKAVRLLEAGKPDRALSLLLPVLVARPSLAPAQFAAGEAYLLLDSLGRALPALTAAVRLDSTDARYQNLLGAAYLENGHTDDAIVAFKRTTVLAPRFAGGHFNLGYAFAKAGKWTEAIAAFDAAIALDPTDVDTHYERGVAFRRLGYGDAARAEFHWVKDRRPAPADDVVANAGRQLAEMEAEQRYRRRVDLQPVALRGGLDRTPRVYLCPRIGYPSWLKGTGTSGVVTVEFVVDSTGLVLEQSIRVVSNENGDLTAATLDMLKQCSYVPGERAGRPVRVPVRQSWRVRETPGAPPRP